jgi:hypothetical protein
LIHEELANLRRKEGYVVNVDYPTKDVKLHHSDCRYADTKRRDDMKPSSKKERNTGEFWFTESFDEAVDKGQNIATQRRYRFSTCPFCMESV